MHASHEFRFDRAPDCNFQNQAYKFTLCFSNKEMRPAPRPTVSAPSSSALGFLRTQIEKTCFTHSIWATAWQSPSRRSVEVAPGKVAHAHPSARRHLATSLRRHAFVESSLLNLEFLRPYSERSSRFSALASRNPPAPFGFPPETTNSSRYASTDTRPLWKRPWKEKLRKEKQGLKSSVSPAPSSFLDDAGSTSFGRRKIIKGANELKLRCTEFDGNGNVTFMSGEFKKSELIAKVYPINLMSVQRDRC